MQLDLTMVPIPEHGWQNTPKRVNGHEKNTSKHMIHVDHTPFEG